MSKNINHLQHIKSSVVENGGPKLPSTNILTEGELAVNAVTDNELVWTNAFIVLSGAVLAHTANTDIHVTAADKISWNAKLDASAYTPVIASSAITAMTSYAMADSGTSITTSDTLNQAI